MQNRVSGKKYFPWVGPWTILLFLALSRLGALAAVSSPVVLNDSIKPVAEAPRTGPVNPHRAFISRNTLRADEAGATMRFEVALKMRNFAELQARVARGERISPQEMAAKYDPLPADYQAVTDWLTGQGFAIDKSDAHHMAIFASGKVSRIQQAMKVSFARVTLEGVEYTSAVTAPSVPASISPVLIGINGLQPHIHAHKHLLKSQMRPNITIGGASYLPAQIAQAYQATGLYNNNITGSGQTIAIVIDTFPDTNDLIAFWKLAGVSQSINNMRFIQVVAGQLPSPSGEETLDVEWSSSIAPAAQVRVYATTDLANTDLDQAYEQIYADVTTNPGLGIHQMSMSYGEGESYTDNSQMQTDDQYFVELAAAGVTVFASSGDGGSTPGSSGEQGDDTGPLQVETPASDPDVTAVGGTSLILDSNNNVTSEEVWNDDDEMPDPKDDPDETGGASGGGTSSYFQRPSWQTGTGVPTGTMRLVPDIACSADENYGATLILNGEITTYGGTSWASPTCAAFCALINQARADAGQSSLGLLGPQIYPLIGTANFRDIVTGNNATPTSNGDYPATTGYDEATGIGVPLVQTLAQTLVGSTTLIGVQELPPAQNIVAGQSAAFTVSASGIPTSYQWQRMAAGTTTWSNLSDSSVYSGSATASLAVNNATLAMSGDQFQCVVAYTVSNAITTPSSVLVVDTPLVISTLAGMATVSGDVDATGTAAEFAYPSGVAIDASGNLYIADYNNNSVREVTTTTTPAGKVTTPYDDLFNTPNAIAADSSNNLYVADTGNNRIRKITVPPGAKVSSSGTLSTLGSSASPAFNIPQGIAVDGSGNVYVADTGNNLIRKITPGGTVSTLAGSGVAGYLDNANGTAAEFNDPIGIAVDASGNVYVADFGNGVVRKIASSGAVSTVAGQAGILGYRDGPGGQALFNSPSGVTVDASGNLYVTDALIPPIDFSVNPPVVSTAGGNDLLRKISPTGVVSTIAGQVGIAGAGVGTGSAAQFFSPQAVILNNSGTFYIADVYNQTIRAGVVAVYASLTASQPNAAVFGPVAGQFTVTRTGSTTNSLVVDYTVAGTAVANTDYTALPGTVTIPAGSTAATITVNPIYNSLATSNPTVQLTLTSSSNYNLATTGPALVTIAEPTPYEAWKLGYFGSNAYVSSIGGDLADPNNNGVPNLLEYAFNSNPLQTGTEPLPKTSVVQDAGNSYLAITYTQLNTDPTLTYTVQVTGDLSQITDQWHSGASYTTLVSQSATGNTTQVTVRDNTPIAPTGPGLKRFIRVQVTGQD